MSDNQEILDAFDKQAKKFEIFEDSSRRIKIMRKVIVKAMNKDETTDEDIDDWRM